MGSVVYPTAFARLTPVALNLTSPTPSIDWGDFGTVRFCDPFFNQTVNRWAGGQPPPRVVRTDLGALAQFDGAVGCDPCGLIFHMSRCGSTLLSRLLATMSQTLVMSEPQPLNSLLTGLKATADQTAQAQALRCLIRALGCRRFDENVYLLKLSSWNIRRLHLFRIAFPAAKIVFVQREPATVMASIRADAPSWLQLRRNPEMAESLFNIPADAVAQYDDDEFAAHALAAILDTARNATEQGALIVDYAELASATWTRVAPFLGIDVTAQDMMRMQDEARYYAKDPGKRIFTGDPPERRHLDPRIIDLAARIVEPVYRELDRCRRSQLSDRSRPVSAEPAQMVAF
jgi:hypothetical protein